MGCRDQQSNFNHFVFSNGTWGCMWGLELTFTAPTESILRSGVKEHTADGGTWVTSFDSKTQQWHAKRQGQ